MNTVLGIATYMIMAGLMVVGIMTAILARPRTRGPRDSTHETIAQEAHWRATYLKRIAILPNFLQSSVEWCLDKACIRPFFDLLIRYRWRAVLMLVAGLVLTTSFQILFLWLLQTYFHVDMGFTKVEVAAINKGMGLAAYMTLLGALFGGALMMIRHGDLFRALLFFGLFCRLFQICHLWVSSLAIMGHRVMPSLLTLVTIWL